MVVLRIKELERLYGIQNGATSFQGNQHNEVVPKNSEAPTQTDLASQMVTTELVTRKIRMTNLLKLIEHGWDRKSDPKISEPSQMLDPKNSDEARERIESGMGI